jgi:flavin reductase (DIM6/NTAB) family NADH-FMN oxidoreductase RutF/DNA-binding MarR family transcriptional regulator
MRIGTTMSARKPAFDHRAFRRALGRFPTGVTVVTTLSPDGRKIGLTANSFNSVSLEPPLVLWSLAKRAASLPAFLEAPHYAINVLAADQIRLSRQFAGARGDRFAGVRCREGLGGIPLIEGCTAWFECHNVRQYDGGDHVILVGQVERFAHDDRPALAFHGGGYRVTSHHPESRGEAARAPRARLMDDQFLYLLARASRQASEQFHGHLGALGVAVPHWHVLAALADSEPVTISALARVALIKQPTLTKAIDRMQKLGLVERRASLRDRRQVLVRITRRGRSLARRLLKRAKAHEVEILAGYAPAEALQLKAALRTLVRRFGDGAR